MATLIPDMNFCLSRMTGGEKRFARRIEDKLEDDYMAWYDVPVDKLYPDFIILHPRRGILILEIKDWFLENIKRVTPANITLMTRDGPVKKKNPLEQAKKYAHAVTDKLKRDHALVNKDGKYQGALIFPWGYGVVFSNITRKAFDRTDMNEVFNPDLVIFQDEIISSVDPEVFQERLWKVHNYSFKSTLSMPQVDRIRWCLFPEIRINAQPLFGFSDIKIKPPEPVIQPDDIPQDILKVMDLKQEQFARSLGDGHRVIHGVSGSGKTLILCYRCSHLADQFKKPILVLCFNKLLASQLNQMIAERKLSGRILVYNFHRWCLDQLKLYHVDRPTSQGSRFFDDIVTNAVDAVRRGQIPSEQYGAVLIDEGHDFKQEWLELATKMIDKEKESLLLLYDSAQSIYDTKTKGLGFSLSSVGIKARGRTTIFRINYRNTAEILKMAYAFAEDLFSEELNTDDGIPVVKPESAGRCGAVPDFVQLPSLQKEAAYLSNRFNEMHQSGTPWCNMAVLYRQKFIGDEIVKTLKASEIPFEWLGDLKGKRDFRQNNDSVKVITMHSSKGLEFSTVAIPGIGFMPYGEQDKVQEARLLYVAMTRAVDNLIMTSHKNSFFTQKINMAREKLLMC